MAYTITVTNDDRPDDPPIVFRSFTLDAEGQGHEIVLTAQLDPSFEPPEAPSVNQSRYSAHQGQCSSCSHPVAEHYDMGCIHITDGKRCGCINEWRDEPLASTQKERVAR